MSKKPTTREEYISSLEPSRKEQILALDKIIRDTAPQLEPLFMSGMLGYGLYHYTYKSGREGDRFVIGLASNKNYISLYSCLCKDGEYLTEKYKASLGKVTTGKSCIKFKHIEEINIDTVKLLLKEAEAFAVEINRHYK